MPSKEIAVPLPGEVIKHLPDTRSRVQLIRGEIFKILTESDETALDCFQFAFSPGRAGNRQMDQAIVAERLLKHVWVDEHGAKQPTILASYDMLTHKEVWHHFVNVMQKMGYIIQSGYFLRHAIADNGDGEEEAA